MTSNNEILEAIEKEMRKQAEVVKNAKLVLGEAEDALGEAIKNYRTERERLQREVWAREKLGWCQRCEKFYPEDSVGLLYTEGNEWHGSEYAQHYSFYKRLQSFCESCMEKILSRPRGGEEKFQCFKAKQQDGQFFIFISGEWEPLSEPKDTIIEIERGYIPEKEYCFGKPTQYTTWPSFKLKIGGEEIL